MYITKQIRKTMMMFGIVMIFVITLGFGYAVVSTWNEAGLEVLQTKANLVNERVDVARLQIAYPFVNSITTSEGYTFIELSNPDNDIRTFGRSYESERESLRLLIDKLNEREGDEFVDLVSDNEVSNLKLEARLTELENRVLVLEGLHR